MFARRKEIQKRLGPDGCEEPEQSLDNEKASSGQQVKKKTEKKMGQKSCKEIMIKIFPLKVRFFVHFFVN